MVENIANIPKQLWKNEFRFLKLREKDKSPTGDMGMWQQKNFNFKDRKLLSHLAKGGNYGIIGGFGHLAIVDADDEEVTKVAEKELPETFTINTGSPEEYKKHFFFITDELCPPIRLSKKHAGDIGDIRTTGQYVVAPNCMHPKGGIYEIEKDLPIAKISKERLIEIFKPFVSSIENIGNKKDFEADTRLRKSKFIQKCQVPDYLRKNKIKDNTSKNWKLFPYIVDVLHNRQATISVYKEIVEKQEHNAGAIKGWMKKAREGKLAKSSCKKMREYLNYYHKEKVEEICSGCPIYEKIKKEEEELKKIKSELQKEVFTEIFKKNYAMASELIVKDIRKDNYIFTTRDDVKSEMWIYREGIYKPNGKSFIKEYCRIILEHAHSQYLVNLVIAKIEAETFIDQEDFFKNKYKNEIPVENGILNVETLELEDFSPDKIFFNKLPVKFDKNAECPTIEQFLKDILREEEDIEVAYEIIGSGLLKDYFTEKACMLVGGGRNGKSKFLELIKKLVGAENCASVPIRSMKEDNSSLCELHGKLFNLAGDLSSGDLKETGVFKQTVGRDSIQAHRKFLRDLYFVNYAKHVFACNELPRVYDTTDGFWDKWILLEFPYKFQTQYEIDQLSEDEKKNVKLKNPKIIEEITSPKELSGLLNEALKGLHRLLKNKKFSQTKGSKEIKEFWIRNSDSFASFCIDSILEDYNSFISKKELRKRYHRYCKKHRVKGTGDKSIKATLQDRYGVIESRKTVEMNTIFVWEGIKFKSEI
jgi:P4 family phage/plasmid primase-like protien